jgi:hypothetical protein
MNTPGIYDSPAMNTLGGGEYTEEPIMNTNNSLNIQRNSKFFLDVSNVTRRSCLLKKKKQSKKSRDTVSLIRGYIWQMQADSRGYLDTDSYIVSSLLMTWNLFKSWETLHPRYEVSLKHWDTFHIIKRTFPWGNQGSIIRRDTLFFDSHRGLFALILPYFTIILPF